MGQTDDPDPLLTFWTDADDLIDGYLQSIAFLHERAKEVAAEPRHELDIRRLTTTVEKQRDRSTTRTGQRHGRAINPRHEGFRRAVRVLQLEVTRRLEPAFAEAGVDLRSVHVVDQLLTGEVADLEAAF